MARPEDFVAVGRLLELYQYELSDISGQMPRNLPAQAFWRKVIARLTDGRFTEIRVTEGGWQGVVQRFSVEPAA